MFDGLPVDKITTSMTIPPCCGGLGMYIGMAEKRGIGRQGSQRYHPE
ncbi:MAG: hypothetical protein QGG48_05705 [Desulfatiglandales bacterium]|nr:hypothetical protein [Desulfatiglandales bacterium]